MTTIPTSTILSPSSPRVIARHRDETPAQSPTPGRILIIDDLPTNLRLLSGILKLEGFEVFTAENGHVALEKLASNNVDVVLLDVMMPGMDGFEVCQHIRANPATAALPVVMVTALHETPDRVRALEVGADDFLTKPVEETEVVARIRSLVRSKRDREELQQAYADLRQAQEMRENLSQMLIHDLRTPLTTMLVALDVLQYQGEHSQAGNNHAPPAEAVEETQAAMQRNVIGMCVRSGKHLLSLVNELLDISKLECGEMPLELESLNVADVIAGALGHIKSPSGVAIETDVAPNLPPISADANLLERVLINLLGNAVTFTRNNTSVRVGARLETSSSEPTSASNAASAQHLLLYVQDSGEGILPEDRERIFEKFEQAQNRKAGRRYSTGLGLTFCKLAVTAHGGTIWVESNVGQGSTFFVSLPLRENYNSNWPVLTPAHKS